ncbi:MAG: PDZ domain-containing protein [Proteobacteria bacterium]|nr:PDZ domain-containing protein [Pseudomonadota bacterium]
MRSCFIIFWFLVIAPLGYGQVLLQKAQPTDGSLLGFIVVGTIAQKNALSNVALVKVTASGSVTAVKINSIIDAKYKVTDISDKFVRVVTRESKHYLVFMGKFSGEFNRGSSGPTKVINPEGKYKEDGFERDQGKVLMTGAYRDKIVNQDLSNILMQATAEPFMQNGVIVGFKMSQIDSDSIFAKGGLKDEDVITSLNGQKLNSVAGAITLLKSLKEATSIDVEMLRNGTPTQLTINVQ